MEDGGAKLATSCDAIVIDDDTDLSEEEASDPEKQNVCSQQIEHINGALQDDFMGVFDTSVAQIAEHMGYQAPCKFDLRLGYDLLSWESRAMVLRAIEARRPRVLILAPPCTNFSALTRLWNRKRHSEEEWARRLEEATTLFDFAVLCGRMQFSAGRLFLLEQPSTATSLKRTGLVDLTLNDGVFISTFDQCRFGLTSPAGTPMRKRTSFVHNSIGTHEMFHKCLCNGHHDQHKQIQGTEAGHCLSKWAQNYPRALCEGVVTTMIPT